MKYRPKFFEEVEFARCTPPCELSDMDERLIRKLDEAREIAKFPFVLNSAYRSVQYEKSKGRNGTSSHTKGLAVDLSCGSSFVRFHMLNALIKVGFRRIGVYPTFLHVDLDEEKVSAVWVDKNSICRG